MFNGIDYTKEQRRKRMARKKRKKTLFVRKGRKNNKSLLQRLEYEKLETTG